MIQDGAGGTFVRGITGEPAELSMVVGDERDHQRAGNIHGPMSNDERGEPAGSPIDCHCDQNAGKKPHKTKQKKFAVEDEGQGAVLRGP